MASQQRALAEAAVPLKIVSVSNTRSAQIVLELG